MLYVPAEVADMHGNRVPYQLPVLDSNQKRTLSQECESLEDLINSGMISTEEVSSETIRSSQRVRYHLSKKVRS